MLKVSNQRLSNVDRRRLITHRPRHVRDFYTKLVGVVERAFISRVGSGHLVQILSSMLRNFSRNMSGVPHVVIAVKTCQG